MTVAAEPSLFVFGGKGANRKDYETRFLPEFIRTSDFIESNDEFVLWSHDLGAAVESLFPYEAEADRPFQPPSHGERRRILAFLDRRARVARYAGKGDPWLSVLADSGIYGDDGVRLVWSDLLQTMVDALGSGRKTVEVLSSSPEASGFAGNDVVVGEASVRACRVSLGRWPDGFVDPATLRAIPRRALSSMIQLVEEDGGNTPSSDNIDIVRALERTANHDSVRPYVQRLVTSYRNPKLDETCLLKLGREPSSIAYRISDGRVTYKGVFATTARTREEAGVLLGIASKIYVGFCRQFGFKVAVDRRRLGQ